MTMASFTTEHDISAALCAPAVRLVLLIASSGGGGERAEAHPVVALQTTVRRRYHAAGHRRPPQGAAARQMAAAGWALDGQFAVTEPLVLDCEGDMVTLEQLVDLEGVQAHRLVAATWPPEQDGERLAPLLDRVLEDAREKARWGERA